MILYEIEGGHLPVGFESSIDRCMKVADLSYKENICWIKA